MVDWSLILDQKSFFVKHVKTVFVQVLHNAVRMQELLLCCEQWKLLQFSPCSANNVNANLDKNSFDMFYQIDCCAAIHGWIWMHNVPNESRILMVSCTVLSFAISVFDFEKFGVKPWFFFFFFFFFGGGGSHTVYTYPKKYSVQLVHLSLPCVVGCSWVVLSASDTASRLNILGHSLVQSGFLSDALLVSGDAALQFYEKRYHSITKWPCRFTNYSTLSYFKDMTPLSDKQVNIIFFSSAKWCFIEL